MRRQPSWIKIGLLAGDLLITNFAFIASYFIRFRLFPVWKGVPPFSQYLRFLPLISIILPLIFFYLVLFDQLGKFSQLSQNRDIVIGSSLFLRIIIEEPDHFQPKFIVDEYPVRKGSTQITSTGDNHPLEVKPLTPSFLQMTTDRSTEEIKEGNIEHQEYRQDEL